MVYKKYGITFQNIRKQNRFTLSDFIEIGIPTSTLSDFERGLTMISLDKIDLALQFMGYSLSDFDNYLNYYSPADSILILKETENAVLSKDNKKLQELYEICKQTNQREIGLALKFLLKEGLLEEKIELINYLYDAKSYGIKDLSIFYIIMPHLIPRDILNIINRLRKYGKGMADSEIYDRHLSHLMLEVIVRLSIYGLKDEAYSFINLVEELNLAQSMLLRNLFEITKGFWIYHFKNKSSGVKRVKEIFKILHQGTQPEIVDFYQEKFEKLMKLSP